MMIGRRAYYVSSRPYLMREAISSYANVLDAELAKLFYMLFKILMSIDFIQDQGIILDEKGGDD